MSEPKSVAERVETLVPGVLHWTVHDDRIDSRSESYAVLDEGGAVLIDPLPIAGEAAGALGSVQAICLTGGFHQRSAFRLRERFDVPVWAPRGAKGLVETPDVWFEDNNVLPGKIVARNRPGPTDPHFVFHLERPNGGGVLFVADLLMRASDTDLFSFVPAKHQKDPRRSRDSVKRLLGLTARVLCPAHGAPATDGAIEAMRAALENDAEQLSPG